MITLEVRLGSVRVGWLEELDESYARFSFDGDWLANPRRPILGQLFEDRRPMDIETASIPPCWFAHLLPQGPLRRMIVSNAHLDEDDPFGLLRACGSDLPGAVVLVEADHAGDRPRPQTPRALSRAPIDESNSPRLGFSLAGNQWKLSVRYGERGLVVPVRGESGEWIAKFNDPQHGRLPQVEYATTQFAAACGLNTPETRLVHATDFEHLPNELPIGDGSVYLTKRFDRVGAGRVHMEDFGQILDRPPANLYSGDYAELATILGHLCPGSLNDYLRQLVFSVMVGNGDAHLKNWSIQYIDGRTPRLSPAYDLVPTVIYSRNENLALTLGSSRRFEDIGLSSFDALATAFGCTTETLHQRVHDLATEIRDAWNQAGRGYDDREYKIIDNHLLRMWSQLDTPNRDR